MARYDFNSMCTLIKSRAADVENLTDVDVLTNRIP